MVLVRRGYYLKAQGAGERPGLPLFSGENGLGPERLGVARRMMGLAPVWLTS